MITDTIKRMMFKSLDSNVGKDLVTVMHQTREAFHELSTKEFESIYNEWLDLPSEKSKRWDVYANRKNTNVKEVRGYYNALSYRVEVNGKNVYRAGNSPYDSGQYVSAKMGVGLNEMKKFCIQTTKDMAEEVNGIYQDVKYEPIGE